MTSAAAPAVAKPIDEMTPDEILPDDAPAHVTLAARDAARDACSAAAHEAAYAHGHADRAREIARDARTDDMSIAADLEAHAREACDRARRASKAAGELSGLTDCSASHIDAIKRYGPDFIADFLADVNTACKLAYRSRLAAADADRKARRAAQDADAADGKDVTPV